jgi:hypothetical protein
MVGMELASPPGLPLSAVAPLEGINIRLRSF